ncbi:hypothetical protein Y032_0302g1864 [Ancylostoma ceylanicum]|uniref:Uncharacterized protein n=1 Tax=Ancylostoma ceylanicum TaxID=53326 RepID=A0A016S4F4_9BILA|nr:hypothetical protein Y032_0302g1864 [Ancylostoma ceylanicum]
MCVVPCSGVLPPSEIICNHARYCLALLFYVDVPSSLSCYRLLYNPNNEDKSRLLISMRTNCMSLLPCL